MKGPAIRLHALNLAERARERFEHLFSAAGRGSGLLVNESVAEAVLVDLDTAAGADLLAEYRRRYPERPALILARTAPPSVPGDQVLLKPVEIRSLLHALQQLRETAYPAAAPDTAGGEDYKHADTVVEPSHLLTDPAAGSAAATGADAQGGGDDDHPPTLVVARTHDDPVEPDPSRASDMERAADAEDSARWEVLCGTREDIDPQDEDAVAGLWLSGDGLLLPRLAGAARQALDEQRVLELRAGKLKIVLDGASDYAYADNDEATVQAMCAAGPVAESMSVMPAGKPKAVLLSRSGNPTAHWPTVESAVWQAALWTYRGLLPAGTTLEERVYLSRWPNFTRLLELPHALRIAALWVEQPLSLAATASMLDLPQRYVFALYGAAHALGLSGPARRGADHLFDTAPAMVVPRRPLLGRLVRHLRTRTAHVDTPPSRATG